MLMVTIAVMTTVGAAALCYASTRHQRWFSRPLAAVPARTIAVIAALAGLVAWFAVVGFGSAAFCWLTTFMLSAILFTASSALRRQS